MAAAAVVAVVVAVIAAEVAAKVAVKVVVVLRVAVVVGGGGGWWWMVNVKVKTATATATATAHKQLKKTFYKRPTGPTYPSMGLPGGEKGSAVAIHRQRGTCVRACVGMPGVCVLRVCVRERGEAGTRTFRRDWLQSLPRICEAPARAGVEGGYSLPHAFTPASL